MKKQLAILLIVLLVGMPFLGAWPLRAEAAYTFSGGGNGDPGNPYVILNEVDMNHVRDDLTASYKLGDDIDLSSFTNWEPIGSSHSTGFSFTGSFDGDHHTIRGLKIVSSDSDTYLGLFGVAYDLSTSGSLKNVRLEDVDITVGASNAQVGGLVGVSTLPIEGVSVSGVIRGAGDTIGGVVGQLSGGARVFASEAHVSINSSSRSAGGLIGAVSRGSVESSYATGSVTLTGSGGAGGLVGSWGATSTLANSYAVGSVTGQSGAVGGLVGEVRGGNHLTISNSYAAGVLTTGGGRVGGLVGDLEIILGLASSATIDHAYWDRNAHATAGEIGGGRGSKQCG